jgi:hypothetical protein
MKYVESHEAQRQSRENSPGKNQADANYEMIPKLLRTWFRSRVTCIMFLLDMVDRRRVHDAQEED